MSDFDPDYVSHLPDERHHVFAGRLPDELSFDAARFETLWNLLPDDDPLIARARTHEDSVRSGSLIARPGSV